MKSENPLFAKFDWAKIFSTETGKKKWWLRAGILVFWSLSLGFLGWLMWKSRNELVELFTHANYSYLFMAFLLYLGALGAVIWGWVEIMNVFKHKLGWWTHAQVYCLTLVARRLPGTIWYVGGRLVLYKKLGVSGIVMSIASSLELLLSVVTGGLVGLILIPLKYGIPLKVLVLLWTAVGLGLLLLHPKLLKSLTDRFRNVSAEIHFYAVLKWMFWYAMMWVLGGLMLVQIIQVFQAVELQDYLFVVGAWAISGAAGLLTLFLPSSFGLTEVTLTLLLSQIMPLPLAGTISIITRILSILFELIVAIIFSLLNRKQPDILEL